MSGHDRFQNTIGTIIRTEAFSSNPAERPGDKYRFYEGFEEITVISRGKKDFPAGCWKIRLVTYRNREHCPVKPGSNHTYIAVAPDNMVLGVRTETGERDGVKVGLITLSMFSDYTDHREEILLCTADLAPAEEPPALPYALAS